MDELRTELVVCRAQLADCKASFSVRLEEARRDSLSEATLHRQAAERARRTTEALEQRFTAANRHHEERVAELEGRLESLSAELGAAERTRASDQTQLSKLRERLASLETENSKLNSSISGTFGTDGSSETGSRSVSFGVK